MNETETESLATPAETEAATAPEVEVVPQLTPEELRDLRRRMSNLSKKLSRRWNMFWDSKSKGTYYNPNRNRLSKAELKQAKAIRRM